MLRMLVSFSYLTCQKLEARCRPSMQKLRNSSPGTHTSPTKRPKATVTGSYPKKRPKQIILQ